MPDSPSHVLQCDCGQVEFACSAPPLVTAVCYCADCQRGATQIGELARALPALDPDGGTNLVLFRRDHIHQTSGQELLIDLKLHPKSPTNRVVSSCCHSPLMLRFDSGPHWVSVFRSRLSGDPPPPQMRVNTGSAPRPDEIPNDIPAYKSFPLRFIGKLIISRIAMIFGR